MEFNSVTDRSIRPNSEEAAHFLSLCFRFFLPQFLIPRCLLSARRCWWRTWPKCRSTLERLKTLRARGRPPRLTCWRTFGSWKTSFRITASGCKGWRSSSGYESVQHDVIEKGDVAECFPCTGPGAGAKEPSGTLPPVWGLPGAAGWQAVLSEHLCWEEHIQLDFRGVSNLHLAPQPRHPAQVHIEEKLENPILEKYHCIRQ